jgi:hypothetical protein
MTTEEIKRISDKYNELDKLIYEYCENLNITDFSYIIYWVFSTIYSNEIKVEYRNNVGYNNSIFITFEELEKYSEDKL